MGAYKKSIEHFCTYCGRPARFEVFNARNASMGYFCASCSTEEIKRINRETKLPVNLSLRDRHMDP
jgi:DNA-directed RNA polymerase subunit RPC12/RpoP